MVHTYQPQAQSDFGNRPGRRPEADRLRSPDRTVLRSPHQAQARFSPSVAAKARPRQPAIKSARPESSVRACLNKVETILASNWIAVPVLALAAGSVTLLYYGDLIAEAIIGAALLAVAGGLMIGGGRG